LLEELEVAARDNAILLERETEFRFREGVLLGRVAELEAAKLKADEELEAMRLRAEEEMKIAKENAMKEIQENIPKNENPETERDIDDLKKEKDLLELQNQLLDLGRRHEYTLESLKNLKEKYEEETEAMARQIEMLEDDKERLLKVAEESKGDQMQPTGSLEISELLAELKSLRSTIGMLETELQSVKEENCLYLESLNLSKNQVQVIMAENADLQQSLQGKAEENAASLLEMQCKLNDALKRAEASENELTEKAAEFDELYLEKCSLFESLSEASAQLAESQRLVDEQSSKLNELIQDSANLQREYASLFEECERAKSAKSHMESRLLTANELKDSEILDALTELQQQHKMLEERHLRSVKEFQKEKILLADKLEDAELKIQELKMDIESEKLERSLTETALVETRVRLANMVDTVNALEMKNFNLQAQLAQGGTIVKDANASGRFSSWFG